MVAVVAIASALISDLRTKFKYRIFSIDSVALSK